MFRRAFLSTIAGGVPVVYGFIVSNDNGVEKIKRRKDWYGEVIETDSEFEVRFDSFPNPVVRKVHNQYTILPKRLNKKRIFPKFDEPEHTFKIGKTKYEEKRNMLFKKSMVGFHYLYEKVLNSENKVLVNTVIPESVENKLLAAYRFAQKIEYNEDFNSTTSPTYIRHPLETIIDGVGDCKDKTLLFTAIANEMGYNVGYAVFKNHIGPLLQAKELPDKLLPLPRNTFNVDGTDYVATEITKQYDIDVLERPREDLIMTYTGSISLFNLNKIPSHIEKAINILTGKSSRTEG